MKANFPRRIRLIFVVISLFALVLVAKLYFVQIVSSQDFKERADRQYVRPVSNIFNRGNIYFTNKDGSQVSAAIQENGFIVAVAPDSIVDPQASFDKIKEVAPTLDQTLFFEKIAKKGDPYEEILKRVDMSTADKISALHIPGLTISQEKWRSYPGDETASHVLGLVAYKGNDLAGRYGLERYYEDILSRNNDSVYVNFFAEIFTDIQQSISSKPKIEADIVTSIEPQVQSFLETELAKVNKTWGSDYSGGIVIEPKTGKIFAMAMNPSFNPNFPQEQKNSLIFSNPLVESVYEMGSIMKPLTMSAGLDSGAVTAATTYYDAGFLTLNNKTISNYDGKGRGTVNMQEVLNQSLNTGAAFVALKMGKENFSQYMLNFGLGSTTGIDLPNEAIGLVDNLKSPRDIEHATASYGQGIAMTPIAITRALSVLANGGLLVTPHVASTINYKIGISKEVTGGEGIRVIKKETVDEISRMLVVVVDKALRDGTVNLPNYSVAAKTGTAQVANPNGGGYYEDRYLHSFFGYFPAYNAKFLIFLYTYYPKNVRYASETLTTSFIDITKFLINYYEIPPDR